MTTAAERICACTTLAELQDAIKIVLEVDSCSYCSDCSGCSGCSYCYGSTSKNGKTYLVGNVQLTPQQFERVSKLWVKP